MSAFRRKKLLLTFCFIFAFFVFLQHWTDTKATWKNTIMMKLKKYQIELQQTIDFSNYEQKNTSGYIVDERSRKQRIKPIELVKADMKSLLDVNEQFKKSRDCVQRSRHQIAMYLHKAYESEFSLDYKFRQKKNPILEPKCKPGLDLIIILTTRPGAFYNRAAIRNSWGRIDSKINQHSFRTSSFTYKTVFTVGRDANSKVEKLVEEENKYFKDILRLDYQDTYENLPNKTVLTLEWIADNCQPRYILKTDDDCFVNVVAIAPWLKRLDPDILYVGKKNDYMPVIRDPLHRNYVPFEDFDEEFYKPYCAGGGYMLAGSILKNVTLKARNIKQIINEDAYIGMVTHSLNIFPVDDERFLPFIFSKKSVNKRMMCDWRSKFLMHGVRPNKQLVMHWNALAMNEYPSLCEGFSTLR
ncbi:UDP-GalNAc:beta-1,3-N-acetylgalactosaminyltransferase 1-like [Hydractinia symbiolongicarpus]|uniref:UDP-GalNAc:beta-1, 3-N-acetylgalactosaminyltransferase 1-like n=1 Tax=Hydractinia symbiolongicarpus TaxID=13093 RepID=UPI00254D30A4|nr:UDP-GalNAc:beta-1,3-N-acetylgalactosaminyltransferase 1-like [Hydractinia symbiolongicarpus]